jgi:hypothetical protein
MAELHDITKSCVMYPMRQRVRQMFDRDPARPRREGPRP